MHERNAVFAGTGHRWEAAERGVRMCLLSRGTVATPRGGRVKLPLVGVRASGEYIFELPSPSLRNSGRSTDLAIEVSGPGLRSTVVNCQLRDDGARSSPGGQWPAGSPEATLLQALGRHIDLIHELFDLATAELVTRAASSVVPCRLALLRRLWRSDADEDMASYALIVRVALSVDRLVEDLARRPRRTLQRERALEPVHRVQEIDSACLRWLARQPGRTLSEQIGASGRVLAVRRTEQIDSPENRVLKDFLARCGRAARDYVGENRSRASSDRVRMVRRFGHRAEALVGQGELAKVAPPVEPVVPNYVLQYDARYKSVWHWYNRLRRRESEEDELWTWRHRTWSEMVLLRIVMRLDELESRALNEGHAFEGEFLLGREHHAGTYLDARSPIGPFVLGGDHAPVLVEVALLNDLQATPRSGVVLGSILGLAPDFVLRLLMPGPSRRSILLPIWTELARPTAKAELSDACHRLSERLINQAQQVPVGGLVWPAWSTSDIIPAATESGVRCIGSQVPVGGEDQHTIGAFVATLLHRAGVHVP